MISKKQNNLKHIAFIMDGNRRWAQNNGYLKLEGHNYGYKKVKEVVDWLFARQIEVISLYTFSTENWSRSGEEVKHLMSLLKQAFIEEGERIHAKNYRVLISGRIEQLPKNLYEECLKVINLTAKNTGGIINFCINYGGRAEIVDAVNKIAKQYKKISEDDITNNLYHSELIEPDMIVRTSGEQRLSGFLMWQSAYSELLFLNKYWPDLIEADIDYIINEYDKRNRRFGGN